MNKQIKPVASEKREKGMQEHSSIAEASFTFSHKTSTALTETHYMTSYNRGEGGG